MKVFVDDLKKINFKKLNKHIGNNVHDEHDDLIYCTNNNGVCLKSHFKNPSEVYFEVMFDSEIMFQFLQFLQREGVLTLWTNFDFNEYLYKFVERIDF